jgi:hypothetical protein
MKKEWRRGEGISGGDGGEVVREPERVWQRLVRKRTGIIFRELCGKDKWFFKNGFYRRKVGEVMGHVW